MSINQSDIPPRSYRLRLAHQNERIKELEAERDRLRSIADNNAANGLAAEERVKELEAENERLLKLFQKIRNMILN